MLARLPVISSLMLLLVSAPLLAVTHDEWRDGEHNSQLVRGGPTDSNYRFMLDSGVNVFTGISDCSSMPWPDHIGCGEMFDVVFRGNHHITGIHLWLWDDFEEFFPFQPNGSAAPFFEVVLRSTHFTNTNFFAIESFTRDETFGAQVRGSRLFGSQTPIGVQYFEVGIDNPDGTVTIERWASSALTLQYSSAARVAYRMEFHLNPVPELDGASGPLAIGLLFGCWAWRRERSRSQPVGVGRGSRCVLKRTDLR